MTNTKLKRLLKKQSVEVAGGLGLAEDENLFGLALLAIESLEKSQKQPEIHLKYGFTETIGEYSRAVFCQTMEELAQVKLKFFGDAK